MAAAALCRCSSAKLSPRPPSCRHWESRISRVWVVETTRISRRCCTSSLAASHRPRARQKEDKDVEQTMVATPSTAESESDASELERYGISEDLCEFVNDMTIITFHNFPLQGTVHSWFGLGDSAGLTDDRILVVKMC